MRSMSYQIACASGEDTAQHVQFNQSLRCPNEDIAYHWLPTECPSKTNHPADEQSDLSFH